MRTALALIFILTIFARLKVLADIETGTLERPIIDSAMSLDEAFRHLDAGCPENIKAAQSLIDVRYYSFDGFVHQGQGMIDKRLTGDIKEVFAVALARGFPISSVIPLADTRFVANGRSSDDLSMAANNTSAFNYRRVTGETKLSTHALGMAIDINPKLNPYIRGNTVLPPASTYDTTREGTLYETHPVTRTFLRLGWTWGGHWESLKDYQHFEKEPA